MDKKQLFETYFMENLDRAYRFSYTYTKNREDAEDIVSESTIKALKSIGQLKNTQYMKVWFYRIIANTALTYLRKKNKVVYLDYDGLGEKEGIEDDYSNMSFHEMIETLEPKYKTIIVLRFFENMTLPEIAQVWNLAKTQ